MPLQLTRIAVEMLGTRDLVERFGTMDWIAPAGRLHRADAGMFRPSLDRAWPVDGSPQFHNLLRAIDDADRDFRAGRNASTVR